MPHPDHPSTNQSVYSDSPDGDFEHAFRGTALLIATALLVFSAYAFGQIGVQYFDWNSVLLGMFLFYQCIIIGFLTHHFA